MTDVMHECIVPSIRHVNDRWRDGGLEALQCLIMLMFAVLPISPCASCFFGWWQAIVGQVAQFNLTSETYLCWRHYLLAFVKSGSNEEPDLRAADYEA